MFKYWIKNRLILDFLSGTFLSLLFCFAFVFSNHLYCEKIYNENRIYLNSEIDFQIPNPSVSQLKEINDKSFVEKTFGYFLTKTNVSGKKTSKLSLIMSDNMDNLSMTMYNEKTRIDGITNVTNYAYLDKKAADLLDVKVGDEICVSLASNSVSYIVCAIYDENPLFKEGSVVVDFASDIKSIYEDNVSSNSYSGAFISASNEIECYDYLKTYIPLGRLKERNEFDSDAAYNTYNNAVMSGNYLNEISNFSEIRTSAEKELESAKKSRTLMAFIGAIVIGIVNLIIVEILRTRKSEKKYFGDVLKNKKPVLAYRIYSLLFSTAVFFIISVIWQAVMKSTSVMLVPTLISIALFILSFVVNISQDRKYIK